MIMNPLQNAPLLMGALIRQSFKRVDYPDLFVTRSVYSLSFAPLFKRHPRSSRQRILRSSSWDSIQANYRQIGCSSTSRSVHIPKQEAYGHPEWQSRTVDNSLFEEEDESYEQHNTQLGNLVKGLSQSERRKLRKQDHKNMLIQFILQERFAEANSWLKDAKQLKMEVEPDVRFAILALDQAKQKKWQIALQWMKMIPSRAKRSSRSTSPHTYLAEILQLACDEEVESEIALRILLHLARFGYLSVTEIGNAAQHAMKWYIQYGDLRADPGNQAGSGLRTLRVFQKMVLLDAKHFDQVCKEKREKRRGPNTRILPVMFNSCIRSFCITGQVAKASVWVKSSPMFLNEEQQLQLGPDICDASPISPYTWKIFVDRVDSMGSKANAGTKKDIIRMTEHVSETIEGIKEDRKGRNWALSIWQKDLEKLHNIGKRLPNRIDGEDDDRSPTYFGRLKNSLRTEISHGRYEYALRNYFEQIYDLQLEHIIRKVLPREECKALSLLWKWQDRSLSSDISVSLLGLEALIKLVQSRGATRRTNLETLYVSWIESVAHLQTQSYPTENVSEILDESKDERENSFAQIGAIAPSFSHFLLFMRMIPRAFSYDIPFSSDDGESNIETIQDRIPQHEKSQEWALRIMADMQRFGFQPDRRFWQILIEVLARGLNGEEVEGEIVDLESGSSEDKKKFLFQLLESIGIGGKGQKASSFDLVSPFTYTSLLRALLSVPKSRGGPLIREAEKVRSWLENDQSARKQIQDEPDLYVENVKEALIQLETYKKQELES